MVAECHSILVRWGKPFISAVNVYGVSNVRQTEIHTAETLMSEPRMRLRLSWVLKSSKKTNHQVLIKLQQNCLKKGLEQFAVRLTNSIWNKEELPEEWKSRSLYLSIRRAMKQIVVIIGAYHFCQIRTKFYPTSYFGTTSTIQNSIQEEIKSRLKSGNVCYHSVQNLLSSSFLSKNLRLRFTEL